MGNRGQTEDFEDELFNHFVFEITLSKFNSLAKSYLTITVVS